MASLSEPELLPPAADCCQTCARDHAAHEPHDPDSLYWQMARRLLGEPEPTWTDALAHVAEALRGQWVAALAKHGIRAAKHPEHEEGRDAS